MSPPPKQRQPWSMKWILLAIVVAVVPYTYLRWHFRRPDPAFRPYEDMKNRANTARLLSAGYQRITVTAQRPAMPSSFNLSAPSSAAAGGLPAGLGTTLVEPPKLPAEIVNVAAAPLATAAAAYTIQFTCALADNKQQFAGAEVYVHGEEIVIAPEFEQLSGGLQGRSRENVVLLTVPGGALKPGRYHVTLVGQHASRAWMLAVR